MSNNNFGGILSNKSPNLMAEAIPEMPDSAKDLSFDDIRKAHYALQHSPIADALNCLSHLSNNGKSLKQWEVDKVEKAFLEFLAKHNSPLVKALK